MVTVKGTKVVVRVVRERELLPLSELYWRLALAQVKAGRHEAADESLRRMEAQEKVEEGRRMRVEMMEGRAA